MGEFDASDYLVWKKAYLPSADIRAGKMPPEVGEKVQDKKVDREEWESFLYSRRISLEMMEKEHLIKQQLIQGDNIGEGLRSVKEYFKDYSDFSVYVNDYLKKHPQIAGGESISNDPEDLLKLAQKHSGSQEIISWLGLACDFQNVEDKFRKATADLLVNILLKGKENSLAAAHALYEVIQNDKFTSLYGKDIFNKIKPKLQNLFKSCIDTWDWNENPRALVSSASLVFFSLMEKSGFSNKQKIELFEDASKMEYVDLVYASILTQSDSASSEDILNICRAVSSKIVRPMNKKGDTLTINASLIYCLAYAYLNPKVTNNDAQLIIGQLKTIISESIRSKAGDYDYVISYVIKDVTLAIAIMMAAKFRPVSDPEIAHKTIMEFAKILFPASDPKKKWSYHYMVDVPRDLLLNLSEIMSPSQLASLFSDFSDLLFSRHSQGTSNFAQSLTITLNMIHDRDLERNENLRAILEWEKKEGRITRDQYSARSDELNKVRDVKRRSIISSLSYRTKITLIALGGADLYTSTFEMLYSSLGTNSKNIDAFIDELENADASFPDRDIIVNFIFTLGTFGKLSELFALKPEYFMDILKRCLSEKDEDRLIKNTFFLSDVIKDILIGIKFRKMKMKMEGLLLDQFKALLRKSGRSRKTGAIAFLISRNCSNFSGTNAGEVQEICKGLPEIMSPNVPAKWMSKDQVRTILFFYQQEHFDLIRSMFKGYGYQSVKIDGETYELSKIINGIKSSIRITMNQEYKFKEKILASPEYSIIGHRGHSFQLGETLIYGDYQGQGKLFILGSCGGFRSIPELMDSYNGNYFVATETMGVGETNNVFLHNFLEILAQNKDKVKNSSFTFEEVHKQILLQIPSLERSGIKMPDVTILYDFLAKYK